MSESIAVAVGDLRKPGYSTWQAFNAVCSFSFGRWKRSGAKDVIDQVISEEMVVCMVQRGAEGART
jgi:hypothetical protein